MDWKSEIVLTANALLILGLLTYGYRLVAEYHSKGRWAKNITGLLAGAGLLVLALSLLLTPKNAEILARLAGDPATRVGAGRAQVEPVDRQPERLGPGVEQHPSGGT